MVKCLICILACIPLQILRVASKVPGWWGEGVMNEKNKKPHSEDSWIHVATQKNNVAVSKAVLRQG